MPFSKFLETLDPGLYKEYRMEKFRETHPQRVDMRKVKKVVSQSPVFDTDIFSSLSPISKLNNSHPAREYLNNRKLPLDDLFWTEEFQSWTNSVKPGSFDDTRHDEGRIIIPLRDKEGTPMGYQGRSLEKSGLRYITILLQEDTPKIYGLNKVNNDKTIYITEGPFDSLFLDNAVAMAGADVSHSGSLLGNDVVFVYDNEPRNPDITRRISKQIEAGESVVIWPSHIKEKDINDMILAGHSVQSVVQSHTYSGLTAKLKFNDWKK